MTRQLAILILILGVSGCSNKAVYDNLQMQHRNDCIKEPPPTYDDCVARSNQSFEDYERERNEVLDK